MTGGGVSVAMATYNGERHLRAQLDSIAAQTERPSELVVRDDGSTDATIELLAYFARDAPFPVRVERGDATAAFADVFLRAASLCSGDLVAFCDQDDLWLPTKLETCVSAMRQPGVLLAVHACSVVDENLSEQGDVFPRIRADRVTPALATDPWLGVPGMAMVFDRSLLDVADWRRRPPSHDLDGRPVRHDEWIYGLARALGSIAWISRPLSLYRQHVRNVTGAPSEALVKTAFRTGRSYYTARREQARGWASLLEEGAEREQAERREALRSAAASYRALAERLESRLAVYDPSQSTISRARRVARLAGRGAYRSRRRGGFGLRGLARDAAMVALRRTG